MRFHLALAALAATTAFAAPAAAQNRDSIKAEALIIQPATLQGLENLSFGTIIATRTASGTVTINPNTGERTASNAQLVLSDTGPGNRGRFLGNGDLQQEVPLAVTFPTRLSNVSDRTRVVEFVGVLDDEAEDRSVNTGDTGIFYIGVGGTITIDPDQMPGLYDGDIFVTANFQ
jgi:hypothetical protein